MELDQNFSQSEEKTKRLKRSSPEIEGLFNATGLMEDWYQMNNSQPPVLPPDFHNRLATHIVILLEKHTASESLEKIAELLERHIQSPKMYIMFLKTLRLFTHKIEATNYLAIIWRSLLKDKKVNSDGGLHFDKILRWLNDDYENNRLRRHYSDPKDKDYHFSFLAFEIGDNLISLYDTGMKKLDLIRSLYSSLISISLENLNITQEMAKPNSFLISGQYQDTIHTPYFERFLFNDIYEYVAYRATEAGQENYRKQGINHSVENIRLLLKSLNSIRLQVSQSIVREKTLQRTEEIKKRLSRKNLTEEELITCAPYFKNALRFFYIKKRYTFDYLGIDSTRRFLQGSAIVLGSLVFLYSILDPSTLSLLKGITIFCAMSFFAYFIFDRKYFEKAYPAKNNTEFDNFIEQFQIFFCKMSLEQLRTFSLEQIRASENQEYVALIPDFLEFLYHKFGAGHSALISRGELANITHHLREKIVANFR